jgi:NADPH:quinone reductase
MLLSKPRAKCARNVPQSRRLQVRALVVREFGPISSHHIEEVPDPVAGEHDVLIEVKAIGLNFPDTLMLEGKYQTRPDRPFVPGRDASGVAVAVGRNVSRVKAGDRVIAQVTTGAFAEKLAAPQARCFRIPDSLDFVSAAGMVTIYNTAYVAVVIRGRVKRGETVLVTGASGGVGLATVQVAKAKGARVLAGVTSNEKGQVALASGADALIDLSAADLRESLRQQVLALTDNRGVDAVFDPVGGDVFDAALRAVAYAGRMVIIGFASGRIPEVKGHYVLLKNIAVVGAPLDIHFKMEPQVMDAAVADIFRMYENGQIKPEIMAVYPLGEIHKAMDLIVARQVKGKIVLTTNAA